MSRAVGSSVLSLLGGIVGLFLGAFLNQPHGRCHRWHFGRWHWLYRLCCRSTGTRLDLNVVIGSEICNAKQPSGKDRDGCCFWKPYKDQAKRGGLQLESQLYQMWVLYN